MRTKKLKVFMESLPPLITALGAALLPILTQAPRRSNRLLDMIEDDIYDLILAEDSDPRAGTLIRQYERLFDQLLTRPNGKEIFRYRKLHAAARAILKEEDDEEDDED